MRLLQLTVIHLFSDADHPLFATHHSNFARAIEHIIHHQGSLNNNAIVVTGDISHDGEPTLIKFSSAKWHA